MNNIGFYNGEPEIKEVKFPKGKIQLFLSDGRIISCPLNKFPEIKKLSLRERNKYENIGGIGVSFKKSDEVYHIADFLGGNNACIGE